MIARIEPGDDRIFRWRVVYSGEGMNTETLHFTRLGARFSRWLWQAR